MRALCILSCLTPRLKGVRKVLIINGGILVNGGINGGMSTSYPGLLGDCVAISPGENRNRNFKNLVVFISQSAFTSKIL